jgi:hypothetical protein
MLVTALPGKDAEQEEVQRDGDEDRGQREAGPLDEVVAASHRPTSQE